MFYCSKDCICIIYATIATPFHQPWPDLINNNASLWPAIGGNTTTSENVVVTPSVRRALDFTLGATNKNNNETLLGSRTRSLDRSSEANDNDGNGTMKGSKRQKNVPKAHPKAPCYNNHRQINSVRRNKSWVSYYLNHPCQCRRVFLLRDYFVVDFTAARFLRTPVNWHVPKCRINR